MSTLLILAISSFCVAIVLTPLCRDLAIRWRLVDRPDEVRKFHPTAVPRVGGTAIFIAYLTSFAFLLVLPLPFGNMIREHLDIVQKLFPAATVIFFTGLLDDLLGLKAWQKFAAQIAASAVAILAGLQINTIVWRHLPAWCAIPVTVLWLVGCTNSFNLIDGIDGLAAGIGLFATTTSLIAALIEHNFGLAIATVPLVGALLGILCFNSNPASIFLGDSGSLFIGFLLGCYSILWSEKSATILGMTAPLIALSIPLLDTCLAVVRRFLRRQSICGADRGHIHHKLLARGLTPRRVVILVYVICGLCGALSILQSFARERFGGLIIILFCTGVWIGVRYLKYSEFEVARRLILAGGFRRALNAELQLSTFRDDLAVASTPEQCWKVLQRTYSEFGFNDIRFKVAGRLYTQTTNSHPDGNVWTIRIRLSEKDYINLSHAFNTEAPPIAARYTNAIGDMLRTKAFKMPQTSPNFADISVDVSQVPRAKATNG